MPKLTRLIKKLCAWFLLAKEALKYKEILLLN